MTIRSMTGFAREAGSTGPLQWAWELKTVNGRGLEIRVRVPPGYDAVGEEARRQLAATLTRGQCQLGLTISKAAGTARARVNRNVLAALLDDLSQVKLPEGVGPVSLDGLLAVRGVVEVEDEATSDPGGGEALTRDLTDAAARLVSSIGSARSAEGSALAGIVSRQLDGMERLVAAAEAHPGRQPEAVRARLRDQVAALTDGASSLDPDRLYAEAVLLATRADIREELDRLHAHLASTRELLAAGGAIGRRLDFLAQEFGREANTLCAKAGDVALSRIGLDLKAAVDQFREQVQNVE